MSERDPTIKLPSRPLDGHKGTFGRVLVVAGSRGMSGAACLAGTAALRGGAGLVYVAVPAEIQPIVAGYEPSYLTIALAGDPKTGRLAPDAAEQVMNAAAEKDAVAIGPGLGHSLAIRTAVLRAFRKVTAPLVVDADGLNVLADDLRLGRLPASKLAGPRVLTPHPGEFSRLSGLPIQQIQAQRDQVAREFAATHGVVLLLKGPRTVVTDGEQVAVNTTGNSGMATGGTGDVLTGLIAALLGQGLSPFDAARTGCYLHGLAGDLAADQLSEPGLIASDLLRFLPLAWKQTLT